MKYKVGDRVICIRDLSNFCIDIIGKTGTVKLVKKNSMYEILFDTQVCVRFCGDIQVTDVLLAEEKELVNINKIKLKYLLKD